MIELTGITWNHTRGYLPMLATAQRFSELHPAIEIRWEKRSLQQFADSPIEKLAERYDLLVIDHPFAGYAATHDVLLPFDAHVPPEFLAAQMSNSVGVSHPSYTYGGHQWCLATDAATPVCGYRPDLLTQAGVQLPSDWGQLMDLARRGLVVLPAIPIDTLMNFYMMCVALGEEPFQTETAVVGETVGAEALRLLRELIHACPPDCLRRNPIATWDLLANTDQAALCPFAYGYSNYGRCGYGRHLLSYTNLVSLNGRPLRSTLGGAGVAVSSRCRNIEAAMAYCQYVASPECQSTVYFDSGGQPGHRAAWLDLEVNRRSNSFFLDTLPTLDNAYLRPRYDGYLDFQDHASPLVHRYLTENIEASRLLDTMNEIYLSSRRKS
ncbi:MAG: carbohydrate ABC transporter substrate-binding protein [Bryobacteraceae bacterium]